MATKATKHNYLLQYPFRNSVPLGEKLHNKNCFDRIVRWSQMLADWHRMICIRLGVAGSRRLTLSVPGGVSLAKSFASLSLTTSQSALVECTNTASASSRWVSCAGNSSWDGEKLPLPFAWEFLRLQEDWRSRSAERWAISAQRHIFRSIAPSILAEKCSNAENYMLAEWNFIIKENCNITIIQNEPQSPVFIKFSIQM